MKISSVDRSANRNYKSSTVKRSREKDFSGMLDDEKRERIEQEIKEMLKKIQNAEDKLKKSINTANISEYKNAIKEYLTYVLANHYKLRKDYSYDRLFLRVEVINQKVEELTNVLLDRQKHNINVLAKIDEIAGLLIDLYK